MKETEAKIYEFGPFRLDVAEHRLSRGGEEVLLTPKVFDLLVVLAQNRGRLMGKEELLKAVWPDSFVEEANLNVNVSALRKALGETPSAPQYVETVPRRGYRFVADVRELKEDSREIVPAPSPAGPEAKPEEETRPAPAAAAEPAPASARLRWPGLRMVLLLSAAVIVPGVILLLMWPSKRAADRESISNIRTIAILPFKPLVNHTGDAALEMGMADALITKLSNLPQVTVRPTSAVLKYAPEGADSLAAGRELQVDAVLDGRVQRAENRIRVTVQLLRVSDGKPLWAESFDDYFTNIFAVQESISEKVVSALALRLSRDERQSLAKRYTENTEAYQLYLQGRYYYLKYQFGQALDFYRAAAAKDPEYPLAHVGLAEDYVALAVTTPDRVGMRDRAVEAADKALSLDPNLPEAHNALGWIKFLTDWDWAGAEASLKRALELNPNSADIHTNYGALLSVLGRHDEALAQGERALQLDPVSSDVNFNYASFLFAARRYDQALAQGERALELDPEFAGRSLIVARVYNARGMYDEAIAAYEKRRGRERAEVSQDVAYAYARSGRRAEAERIIQNLLQRADRPSGSYSIAIAYAGLGDHERAFEWLERAYEKRDNAMIHLKVDPEWDTLRDDPRFADLLKRMRLT